MVHPTSEEDAERGGSQHCCRERQDELEGGELEEENEALDVIRTSNASCC